jgi:NADH-quinone oxidoreductase subunit G
MATLYVDGKPYPVNAQQNLLQQCLTLGLDIPYFCWHPALGSVGACRQCAIKQFKDENDSAGKIVIACMTPAQDGTRISIDDREAAEFRAGIIEWLMENHPHDCPVCDEGGECHLQDMTVMTGHNYRRYRFKKRTFRNQDLGPFINHEMNRCITCYRCVRFYREYAGGTDLVEFASKNHVYFGRHRDGALESEFSGNLVEVCPTGVFTDKTLKRHYTRKWDLQTAPSVCPHCGVGCDVIPGERYGKLRRILNRYHAEVNGYFLCDRGRFGYEFVNGDRRVRWPYVRRADRGGLAPTTPSVALKHLAAIVSDRSKVIGIGSPRASIEANFALRSLVGPANFYAGLSENDFQLLSLVLDVFRTRPVRRPSLRQVEEADAVLVLGEDVTQTAPRLALALRQCVRHEAVERAAKLHVAPWLDDAVREASPGVRSPLFVAAPSETRLDDVASWTWCAAPDDLARLGFAIAHALSGDAPGVEDLPDDQPKRVGEIAETLASARRPLIVSGTACGSAALIQAAANVATALARDDRPGRLCLTVPECNSLGLALMEGQSLASAFERVQTAAADTVVVVENDLYRRAPRASVEAFLESILHLAVLDHLAHDTASRAEVVLPAATFAEASGTLVSDEGRAQRYFRVFEPERPVAESWAWLRDLAAGLDIGETARWPDLDSVIAACASTLPALSGIVEAAPSAGFRVAGQKIPREPHRYSGRTAMHADLSVHEHKPLEDPDGPFSYTMEGYPGRPPAPLIPFHWSPGWNSVQSVSKFQSEVGGPLRDGDPGVRLLEPSPHAQRTYFRDIPGSFAPRDDVWLVVPLYHIFGSEELSALAQAIAQRVPAPYVALSPEDAGRIGAEQGSEAQLEVGGEVGGKTVLRLPVRIGPGLPRGVAGLPAGLPGLEGIPLPQFGRISGAADS